MTKKKNKAVVTIAIIVCVLELLCVVGILMNIENAKTTDTLNYLSYSKGLVDTDTGNVMDSNKNLVSELASTKELKITLVDNPQISYKVAYYDEDENFISITETLTADLVSTSIPSTAKYFRVQITPLQVDGEDVIITQFNRAKYISMLEVEFAK